MFTLTLRFLDGSSRSIKFSPPDDSIATLRALAEQSLEPGSMNEVRLLQGDRELNDNDSIELEIQAITTASVDKALRALDDNMIAMQEAVRLLRYLYTPSDSDTELWECRAEKLEAALDVLDGMPLSRRPEEWKLQSVLDAANFPFLPIRYANQFGRLVGRICLDDLSERDLESCCRFLKDNETDALVRAAAYVEIAQRDSSQLHSRFFSDAAFVDDFLRELVTDGSYHQDENCGLRELVGKCCMMLGHHGNASHIESLQMIALHDPAMDACVVQFAVEQIRARASSQPDISHAEAAHRREVEAPTRLDKQEKAADENAALIQAYQNSKLDVPKEGVPLNSDGVVVLRLTRMAHSPALRNHLKTTPTLALARQSVVDAGCSLEPSWAAGAQLFVPLTHEQVEEAGLELAFDYVLLLSSFYEDFKVALQEFNCRGKKRPKLAPMDLGSMFEASSSSACPGDELEKEEGAVEVEPVSIMALRTDSSVGFPHNPYFSM